MGKIIRTLIKDAGEILSHVHAGFIVAGIGVIVAALNWNSLIKAAGIGEYVGLVLLWLIVLIVLSVIGVLGCKYLGHGLIWLSNWEWHPAIIYFPKLELSCSITPSREIELQVINRRSWQKITLRAEYYCAYLAGSRPSIRGVAPPTVKELLPLARMTGKDARVKIIGKLRDDGITLSTGNESEEINFSQSGLYYYEVNLNGKYRGKKFGAHGKLAIRIKENHEVECV